MQKTQHTRKYKALIKALKAARRTAGITQTEVADHFGTYASFISKFESGERKLDVIELAAICQFYKITVASI